MSTIFSILLSAGVLAQTHTPLDNQIAEKPQIRKLKSTIYPGVELGFNYNLLLESSKTIDGTTMRNVLLETLHASIPDAIFRLEANLNAKGFNKHHQEYVEGSDIRNYLNERGDSVSIQANSYKSGNKGIAPGSTGTININIRTKK